jgi:hypothetical protein
MKAKDSTQQKHPVPFSSSKRCALWVTGFLLFQKKIKSMGVISNANLG